MGCVCGKGTSVDDTGGSSRERLSKAASDLCVPRVDCSSRREQSFRAKDGQESRDGRVMLIDKQVTSSTCLQSENFERKKEKSGYVAYHNHSHNQHLFLGTIPMGIEGEQMAAGWPRWLTSVAGEAIKGWIPRRADSFEKLDKIGQGTYSSVYRARDLDHGKIVALKRVRFDNMEPESVRFMAREINILRRLDHPNIIKLEGLITSRASSSLYLVFEYMEHDLAGLARSPGSKFTEPQVKCYMQQLLRGLDHCHSRGVVHRDIKGANLLIDNNGFLKIADFGLATFFDPHQSQPLTSKVVTLWYRPPELLLGATHYGSSVDLWSTGCILAELYAGQPILQGRTEVEQLHKIFRLCGSPSEDYWEKAKLPHATSYRPQQPYRRRVSEVFRDFPPAALGLMDILLSMDPVDRGTAASALKSEFFTTKPFACDPSTLPKYPPSKELDAKVQDEARRQAAARDKGQGFDRERKAPRESRAMPAPGANAELAWSLQNRQGQSNTMSRSEKFNPHQEEVASGFAFDPPRQSQAVEDARKEQQRLLHKRASHSGPLVHQTAWAKTRKNQDDGPEVSTRTDSSSLSGLVAARRSLLSDDRKEKYGSSYPEEPNLIGRFPGCFNEASESTRKQEQNHVLGLQGTTHQKENGRTNSKDQSLPCYGSKGHKIHYSGPLVVPSGNVDQILKDHDRHIQEAIRRAQLKRYQVQRSQIPATQIFASAPGPAVEGTIIKPHNFL